MFEIRKIKKDKWLIILLVGLLLVALTGSPIFSAQKYASILNTG